MKEVLLFIMTYVLVFICYRFLVIRKANTKKKNKRKKNSKSNKPIEVSLLEAKYHLDLEKLDYNKLLWIICAVSSLDITIIITLILLLDSYLIQLLIALILTFPIILVSYSFIGKYYVKKGMIKDE